MLSNVTVHSNLRKNTSRSISPPDKPMKLSLQLLRGSNRKQGAELEKGQLHTGVFGLGLSTVVLVDVRNCEYRGNMKLSSLLFDLVSKQAETFCYSISSQPEPFVLFLVFKYVWLTSRGRTGLPLIAATVEIWYERQLWTSIWPRFLECLWGNVCLQQWENCSDQNPLVSLMNKLDLSSYQPIIAFSNCLWNLQEWLLKLYTKAIDEFRLRGFGLILLLCFL